MALDSSNPFRIYERIGGGGMGEVFRARTAEGREVCVKRIAPLFLTRETCAAMREEGRLLRRVRHPNVIGLCGAGEDAAGPYLVLEFVRGCDLAKMLDRAWPAPLAVHVVRGVLRALSAVQRVILGLVHRDVTPHNVLLSEAGEVKLADFGIAVTDDGPRHTLPGFVKGKAGYMAPEQILGEPLDPRVDLFAAGVVLYELLTGARPCAPRRGLEELRATVDSETIPLKIRRPDLPDVLANAVNRLISRAPHDRFATAEQALDVLEPFDAGADGPALLGESVRTRAHSGTTIAPSTATISMETSTFHG